MADGVGPPWPTPPAGDFMMRRDRIATMTIDALRAVRVAVIVRGILAFSERKVGVK